MALWRLAFRLARRELRGSINRFSVFLVALILGVAAIGSVGSIAESMRASIALNSQVLFGGDIEASAANYPIPEELRLEMSRHGEVSGLIETLTMLGTDTSRKLVSVKAIDSAWPLIGAPLLDPPIALGDALATEDGVVGIIANPDVLRFLELEVGDTARLGGEEVQIRTKLIREPDRSFRLEAFAPRVIITKAGLRTLGLDATGAVLTYRERLLLNSPQMLQRVLQNLLPLTSNTPAQLYHHRDNQEGFIYFLNRTEIFLTLVSLTSLLIGGLGVSMAVRAWLIKRMPVLATLKCLGASEKLIFRIYFLQVMLIALAGTVIGLVFAALTPLAASLLLDAIFPVPITASLYAKPLITAGGFGILTAIAFSLLPLGKASAVKPSQLFRTIIEPPQKRPHLSYIIGIILATIALMGLTLWAVDDTWLALSFIGGTLASFALLTILAEILIQIAKRIPPPANTPLRLALATLVRPGNSTRSVVISFGLGFAVLVAVALSEHNLNRQIDTRLSDDAPSWYFVNIQAEQRQDFFEVVSRAVGEENVAMVPMARGRVVALNGVATENLNPTSDEWVLEEDRGLTWSATLPKNTTLISGEWWAPDYQGALLVSMDDEAMRGLGLGLGDTVGLNIAGREVEATIANSRAVEWETFNLSFVFILSPGAIEQAPHHWIATVSTDDLDLEAEIERQVAVLMPNVSAISVREAAGRVIQLLGFIATSIQITAVITLIAGFVVLAGTVATSEAKRIHIGAILKVLGATRRTILFSYILEYSLLGLLTVSVASVIGTLASWGLMTWFLESENFTFSARLTGAVALGGTAITVLLGLVSAFRALGKKPGAILRSTEA